MPHHHPTQLQGITDLTVLADIKPGLVKGIFESRSYAWRLKTVLGLLDAARHAARESSLQPNPFIDNVGRLRGVQFFRFAVPPPGRQLLLNVTFDGGWEPYIRHIWRPLGTLLDFIFCHCEGYPLAAASSFEKYVDWIRRHEVPGLFFYADSAATVGDVRYLSRLEALQRKRGDRDDADLRAARLALQPPQTPAPSPASVMMALRNLKGLYGLTSVFGLAPRAAKGVVPEDDGSVLLRFAQDFLPDLRSWYAQGLFDPGQRFDTLRAPFQREGEWLMSPAWTRTEKVDLLSTAEPGFSQSVQAGILSSPRPAEGRHMRGALVLVRVRDAAQARSWLMTAAGGTGGAAPLINDGTSAQLETDAVLCTVAITYPGLKALGVPQSHLDALPAEFVQGMEARAGVLGDLRGNHPQHWNRPRAGQTGPGTGSQLAPIDLGMVHLVIQLRTAEADDESAQDRSTLLPRLQTWIGHQLPQAYLEVLAVEPGWSRPRLEGEPASRDHFGYVDGVSQPTLDRSASNQFWDDAVKTGELLLGWTNDRGDGPTRTPTGSAQRQSPVWLDGCTFLVIRKIRQHVERFDALVERAAKTLVGDGVAPTLEEACELVRTKLMGRDSRASPPVAERGAGHNDFDYRHDSEGGHCPFASHVRRANPRVRSDAGFPPPRIMRRGMSYGPSPGPGSSSDAQRGVLFMAYNASIAEQFEVIQRWLTGGNSSGVPSSRPDPFLGVPQQGEPHLFVCTHRDHVLRFDLGDEPINSLEWGLYTFVPSMALLRSLDKLTSEPAPPASEPTRASSAPGPVQQVKQELEDELTRGHRWSQVRGGKNSGVEKFGPTVLVGSYDRVMQVLADDGGHFSVRGYGERMRATLGASPFGQDEAGPNEGHQRPHVAALKQAIGSAVEEPAAFQTARDFVRDRLIGEVNGARQLGLQAASIDIVHLGQLLVAHLCRQWFGMVFDVDDFVFGGVAAPPTPVRCPGHFLVMARRIFSAYPNTVVDALAADQAPRLKDAMARLLQQARSAGPDAAPVMQAVLGALKDAKISDDERQDTVANVILGLPATLLGTWVKVLMTWTRDRRLWRLQHDLATPQDAMEAAYENARRVIREELVRTMSLDPVADGIWRTAGPAASLGDIQLEEGDIVWLGLGAALQDRPGDLQAAERLLFGGAVKSGEEGYTPHACPGRGLAMGALLGALSALLLAGQWSASASPTTLVLQSARQ